MLLIQHLRYCGFSYVTVLHSTINAIHHHAATSGWSTHKLHLCHLAKLILLHLPITYNLTLKIQILKSANGVNFLPIGNRLTHEVIARSITIHVKERNKQAKKSYVKNYAIKKKLAIFRRCGAISLI